MTDARYSGGSTMTTLEKFKAIKAVDDRACLRLSSKDSWYVDWRGEVARDGMLFSEPGFSPTTEGAICSVWREIEAASSVRLDADRRVRWNGFMWEPTK